MKSRKPAQPSSEAQESRSSALQVAPRGDEWLVRREGAYRASSVHKTQIAAIDAARRLLRKQGGALRIHGKDGRIEESLTLGRRAAAKISAVEGISLGGSIRRDLETFDRERLTPEERRSRIWAKYVTTAKTKPKR